MPSAHHHRRRRFHVMANELQNGTFVVLSICAKISSILYLHYIQLFIYTKLLHSNSIQVSVHHPTETPLSSSKRTHQTYKLVSSFLPVCVCVRVYPSYRPCKNIVYGFFQAHASLWIFSLSYYLNFYYRIHTTERESNEKKWNVFWLKRKKICIGNAHPSHLSLTDVVVVLKRTLQTEMLYDRSRCFIAHFCLPVPWAQQTITSGIGRER